MSLKINKSIKDGFLKKFKSLCTPAGGCTEIGAIGYSVAAAAARIKGNIKDVKRIEVSVSPYIFKNVMRVGVPNLGTCGISMIIAASAAIAEPKRKLQILNTITKEQQELGKWLVSNNKIFITIPNKCDPVHVLTTITYKNNTISALVEGKHDNLALVKLNGKIIYKSAVHSVSNKVKKDKYDITKLSVEDIFTLVDSYSLQELSFIQNHFKLNVNISEYGKKKMFKNSFTQCYAKTLPNKHTLNQQIMLDLAAAIDARMGGVPLSVMSSCGSGDHGLTCTIPQYTYYKYAKGNKVKFLRALLLTNLLVWKIKSNIGDLSCMCGSVIAAATAATVSIAYQMGYAVNQLCQLMEMLLCTFNSVMCDGAKLSCTHKICTAMVSALEMLDMLKYGYYVKPLDGIVFGDVNHTLLMFAKMSKENSDKYNLSIVNGMCKMKVQI